MASLINAKNLSKHFGALTAVSDVSLSVNKGEIVGFLGPNGAGKTTTMRLLTGFLSPDEGTVEIANIDMKTDPAKAKHNIGYLPEGGALYSEMLTEGFLDFVADIRQLEGEYRQERLDYVMNHLHLMDVLARPIDTLSKGYKRRIALAQALMHDPDVLIMDEPTDGLDPIQKREVEQLIREISHDKAVLISTHILDEVEHLCDRALVISEGKICARGTIEELAAHHHEHNAVIVRVADAKTDDMVRMFMELKNVREVIIQHDKQIIIYPKKGRFIVDDVSDLMVKNKWIVERLYRKPTRLRPAFCQIVSKESL